MARPTHAEEAYSLDKAAEPLARVLEVRLRALSEREEDRDRETKRLREENADLRRELHSVQLETTVLKHQIQNHIKYAEQREARFWQLIYAALIGICLFPAWIVVAEVWRLLTGHG